MRTVLRPDSATRGVVMHRSALVESLEERTFLHAMIDSQFGNAGRVDGPRNPHSVDLEVQRDGRIIVHGWGGIYRYNTDGTPDLAFGVNGRALADAGVNAVALQSDGAILAAGYDADLNSLVMRFLPDGTPDPAFGVGGTRVLPVSDGDDAFSDLAVMPDGDIIAVGGVEVGPNNYEWSIVRLNGDGSPDHEFGAAGVVVTHLTNGFDYAIAVHVQSDGRIVVAGAADVRLDSPDQQFALARYRPDGSLDESFGLDGTVRFQFDESGYASDVFVQPDGHVVFVGWSGNGDGHSPSVVARLRPDGSMDPTFGDGGVVRNIFGLRGAALALAPDGNSRLWIAGSTGDDFALARLTANGLADRSFTNAGVFTVDFGELLEVATVVKIAPGRKVLMAGPRPEASELVGITRLIIRERRSFLPVRPWSKDIIRPHRVVAVASSIRTASR